MKRAFDSALPAIVNMDGLMICDVQHMSANGRDRSMKSFNGALSRDYSSSITIGLSCAFIHR